MVPCGSGFVWTSVLSLSSPEAVVAATSLYPCSWIGPCPRNHGVWQAYINLLVLRTLQHLTPLLILYVPFGSRNTTFLGFPYNAGHSSPSSSSQELLEFTEDLLGLLGDPSSQLYLCLRLHGSSVPVGLARVSHGKVNLECSNELQASLSSNEFNMHHTPSFLLFE